MKTRVSRQRFAVEKQTEQVAGGEWRIGGRKRCAVERPPVPRPANQK